jgi:beta-phosphoglucomutase
MFKAAIFDWDGTLANTKKVIVSSFKRTLSDINCYPNNKLIERLIGIGSAQTFREILRIENVSFDEKLIESLVSNKVKNSIKLSRDIELFNGAKELLKVLEGKIKLGLASMNKREFIDYMLQQFGLSDLFEVVITADEVIKAKPDPEIFLKCAKIMQVKPEKCVIFEDSIFGVRAAKGGRMSCVAVLTGVYDKSEITAESPDLIVNSLMENQKILNFLFP